MKRRAYLSAIGIGVTTIAGCVSGANVGDQSPNGGTDRPTDEPESTRTTEPKRVPADETIDRTVGDGSLPGDGVREPHGIVFDNPTEKTWTGRLVVRHPDDSVALDETYELESGTKVVVTLTDPLRYTAQARISETEASEIVDVDLSWFDCNASSTSFTLKQDGTLETGTISTLLACLNVETERVAADTKTSHSLGDGSLSDDGDRKPHGVTLVNQTDTTQTVRLVLRRETEVLLDGLYTLESDASVAVSLTEAGHYEGTASVPAAGTSETFDVKPELFDCNASSTNVTVSSDGEVDSQVVSTMMACENAGVENETSESDA